MKTSDQSFGRVLVLAAHPDDETIACSGLLQRAAASLVVFAVDGAPLHYNFEKKFGSLQRYSEARFREASRALAFIPNCGSLKHLSSEDGKWFVDQHLFLHFREAFISLTTIVRDFGPDLLVSHAFEGGHIDHDACHVLTSCAAFSLRLPGLEFPLYRKSNRGEDVFQQFLECREDDFALQLLPEEMIVKRRMLAQYETQKTLTSVFRPETERFRPMVFTDHTMPRAWSGYPFENRRKSLTTDLFFRKVSDFIDTRRSQSQAVETDRAALANNTQFLE